MDNETRALVQRWMTAFHEGPILIDADLMRQVLADVEGDSQTMVAGDSPSTRA